MIENWTDELVNNNIVDFYYSHIRDWYMPKMENKLLPNKKDNSFYSIKEPYDCDD